MHLRQQERDQMPNAEKENIKHGAEGRSSRAAVVAVGEGIDARVVVLVNIVCVVVNVDQPDVVSAVLHHGKSCCPFLSDAGAARVFGGKIVGIWVER